MSFKGAKQAVTAFAPKIEAARPAGRPALIDALLAVIAYHRVGDRPGAGSRGRGSAGRSPGARLAPTTSRGQAAGESLEMVLKLVPFVRASRDTQVRGGFGTLLLYI